MPERSTEPRAARLRAAPVRETYRLSVEGDLLDPSLRRWERTFQRRVRGSLGTLRGKSRDRLDALGEVFFEETLKGRLLFAGVERIREAHKAGRRIVLTSDGLEPAIRPLARHVGADRYVARRIEFRAGIATGRLLPADREIEPHPTARRPPPAILTDGPAASGPPLGVRRALKGRNVLVIGVTGFIGKVWVASLLEDLPELGTVSVLLRRRGTRTARDRFVRIVRESPVFGRLRRLHGRNLGGLQPRIEVIEGDVSRPRLGLEPVTLRRLAASVDLIVNCAGLTEFNPDLRDALAINVDGTLHLLDFLQGCERAALLHISTCFVAGKKEGRIPERIAPDLTPAGGRGFDPEAERCRLHEMIEQHAALARSGEENARSIRRPVIEDGLRRARELGWPNIYTFTKALGEALIARRVRAAGRRLPVAVVRPSIVETALDFPFRGWNEGINTSAPLSHLLGSYFRQLPVNQRKRLDVIPVDLVGRGLTLVAAALVERRHELVYQLATSAVNPLDLRRAVELTALAHRKHYRARPGWRSKLLARLEAVPVSRERYGRLSVPAQLRVVRGMNRFLNAITRGRSPLARLERILQRVTELIDLYEPFLLDNEPVFEADHIAKLSATLPPDEQDRFGYDPRSFDWYDYWIDVHIPGLRRWSFPLLEGRPIERWAPGEERDSLRARRPGRSTGRDAGDLPEPVLTPATPASPET